MQREDVERLAEEHGATFIDGGPENDLVWCVVGTFESEATAGRFLDDVKCGSYRCTPVFESAGDYMVNVYCEWE